MGDKKTDQKKQEPKNQRQKDQSPELEQLQKDNSELTASLEDATGKVTALEEQVKILEEASGKVAELEGQIKTLEDKVTSLEGINKALNADLDAFVGAPAKDVEEEDVPLREVLQVVKRTRTIIVKKGAEKVPEERESAITPGEVLSYRVFPDRFVVVTDDGQKFTADRE